MAHRAESVFVDATGRRSRLIRRAGLVVAVLLTGYLALVGVGLFVGADVPLTPWPGDGKAGSGVGAELGRRGAGMPPPTTRPTTARPSPLPSTVATPSRPAGTPPPGRATATPSARSRAVPPGHTKSPNPHKP